MLSYRHGFHAGNHADILKHLTLCLLLRALIRKDKPCCVTDTHAGGGIYDLNSPFAAKNREYHSGIDKIRDNPLLPRLVPEYFEVLKKLQQRQQSLFPGSPYFEQQLLRPDDRICLIDLHPAEFAALKENFGRDKRISIHCRDGFEALEALLPPRPRRGLCLVDPAYEDRREYHLLVKYLKIGLKHWQNGCFAVWYPVLGRLRDHSKNLVQELHRLNFPLLQAELRICAQGEDLGMCGSGMLILNYPFGLEKELNPVMAELFKCLSHKDGGAVLRLLNPRG